jgi:uncharacterized protein YqiB (DUF1249 family)
MFQTAPTQIQRHQTRDLAALIDLYEANYLRLMQLVPELDHFAQGTVVSRVAGALDLFLTVQERFKYTTAISLTYRFEGDDGALILEPFARISIYHDVRAAEVVSHCRRKRVYARRRRGRLDRMPEVHRRFELNRFLLKWLRFCTHQGHIFLSATARVDEAAYRLIRHYQPPARADEIPLV